MAPFSKIWSLNVLLFILGFPFLSYSQISVSPNKINAAYEAGETMAFVVNAPSSGPVSYVIRYDQYSTPLASGTINVTAGQPSNIFYTHPTAGTVFCVVNQWGAQDVAGAAFSAYDIVPSESEPNDFDAFWTNQKAQLANVPMDPNLEFYAAGSYANTYRINLAQIDGRRVYGYISIPTGGAGQYPAVLEFPAFGASANQVNSMEYAANDGGVIAMTISVHNAPTNQQDPNAYQPDNINDPNGIYMRYAILAGIRAIDYIFSRSEFDGQNLCVTGLSQGGALALMMAGIDNRVNLLSYANPAWGDHGGLHYDKGSGFPFYIHSSQTQNGTPEHQLATLSATRYYDIINFAKRYDGPSLGFIAYEDEVSIPSAMFAAFNQLKGERILQHRLKLGHNPAPADYWNKRFDFWRSHYPTMLTPPNPWASKNTWYRVDAGPDQNATANTPVSLTASVSNNGQTNGFYQAKWEMVSGPASVSFSNPNAYNTTANFPANGTYVLRFTAVDESEINSQDSYITLMDEVSISVDNGGGNNYYLNIACPTDQSYTIAQGQNTAQVFFNNPTVDDNCSGDIAIQQLAGPSNAAFLTAGTYTVEYRADNNCGLSKTCSFNITVEDNGANPGPNVYCGIQSNYPWEEWISQVRLEGIDNVSGKTAYGDYTNLTANLNAGQSYPLTILAGFSWQSNDAYVKAWIDYNQDKQFSENEEVVLTNVLAAGNGGATSSEVSGTIDVPANALEGNTRMRIVLQRGSFPSSCDPIAFGEVEDYNIQITSSTPIANLSFDCPQDLIVQAPAGANETIVNWTVPTGNTTCSNPNVSVAQLEGLSNGAAFPVGTTTVTYQATDNCNNTTVCSFDVTVLANTNTGAELNLNCPENITVQATVGANEAIVNWTVPTATTTCFNPNTAVYQLGVVSNGTAFSVGTSTITYQASDNCNNAVQCSFEVTVLADNSSGSELSFDCPQDITIQAPVGANEAIATWTEPTASTTCFISNVEVFQLGGSTSGTAFPVGTTRVSYQASDNCNNMIECGFDVTVLADNNSNPNLSFDCPQDLTIQAPAGASEAIATWIEPTASTTCFISNVAVFQLGGSTNGRAFPVGTTKVIYQAIDNCNNLVECSFDVTVLADNNSNTDLSFDCPQNITVEVPIGGSEAIVNWTEPTATTTCNFSSVAVYQLGGSTNGTAYPIGTNKVTYQAADNCNSLIECSFDIVVLPNNNAAPADYCSSAGERPWRQYINNVRFNTIDNDSQKEGYGDFTNLNTNLINGQAYLLNVQPGFSFTHFTECIQVWIDYNQDGDFEDFGELVLNETYQPSPYSSGTSAVPVSALVNIPNGALEGATRMRVSMQKNNCASSCDAFRFGEVEDYTVTIGSSALFHQGEVNFLYLNAAKNNNRAKLNWQYYSTKSTEYLEVQRADANGLFESIEQISIWEEGLQSGNMEFEDSSPLRGVNHYRILQVFQDGTSRYSTTRSLQFGDAAEAMLLYPNPAQDRLNLWISSPILSDAPLKIYRNDGREVLSTSASFSLNGETSIDISALPNGHYQVVLWSKTGKVNSQSFIVNKNY